MFIVGVVYFQLADVFLNKTMFIQLDHPDYAKLKRYAIAYGAVIEIDRDDADVVVQTNRQPDNDRTASGDWLFESVKAGKMVEKF